MMNVDEAAARAFADSMLLVIVVLLLAGLGCVGVGAAACKYLPATTVFQR